MSKEYQLIPSRTFLKDLEKLPADMKPKVEKVLLELKQDPHSSSDIKKLRNVAIGKWRLRIGDWRLRYDIKGSEILLHVIRHRRDVYKKR
ncbi:MAG: type II toxin-antitoxin system RelE/ParE family toxin [Actinobacteria bacterium]|nr:type II toxin-antitoxin system RelE/ParE family toxin [Actinomycetota bacterium]